MSKKASSVARCIRPFLMSILLLLCLRAVASAQDIPIGVLHSITGVTAADEAQLKDFVFFLVKEQNDKGGVLGRKLRAIAPDGQSAPMVFKLRASELIAGEKVSVVFGGWSRASLFAMAPLFKGNDTILFYPANILSVDSLPQERSIFYVGFFPEQLAKAAITYMNSSVSPSLWVLLGNESSEAGAMNAMMRSILTKTRGVQDTDVLSKNVRLPEVAQAATDIASFTQSRKPMKGPTAVLTTLPGLGDIAISGDPKDKTTDLNRFPIISFTLRESQLPASSKGQLGIVDYYQAVATRANTDLLRRWRIYTNNPNSSVDDAMASYATAFAMWVQAVEKVRTVEAAKVIDALPNIAVETLAGSVSAMLPDHRITKQARVVRVNDAGKFELVWSENDVKRSAPAGGSSLPSQPAAPSLSAPVTPPVANLPRTPPGRASIEQTQPGTGAQGDAELPANSNVSSDSAPILAAPTLVAAAAGPDSRGSAQRCATPTTPTIPMMDAFQRATSPPPYCREGFKDVVLIDTGDEEQDVRDRVCSGVRVGSEWVLTAKHCVASWTDARGRVFALTNAAYECLDHPPSTGKHPGESCSLPVIERNGQPTPAEDSPRKIDLALIRVLAPRDTSSLSSAKVRKFAQSGALEITLAGFGAAPGTAPGTLRVGWSRIVDVTALQSMSEETELNMAEVAVPIRFTQQSYGSGSPGSWACKGDSGSPVFAGRVFGYRNEPHLVAGIVTQSSFVTAARCASDAAVQGDSTKIVPLMHPEIRKWLCSTTNNNLDLCR